MTVLSKEIALEESHYLLNLTIDPNSLDIKGEFDNHTLLQSRIITKLKCECVTVTGMLH